MKLLSRHLLNKNINNPLFSMILHIQKQKVGIICLDHSSRKHFFKNLAVLHIYVSGRFQIIVLDKMLYWQRIIFRMAGLIPVIPCLKSRENWWLIIFAKFHIEYDSYTNQTNSIFLWLETNIPQLGKTSILHFNRGVKDPLSQNNLP